MSRRASVMPPMVDLDDAVQSLEFVMQTVSDACGENAGWPAWMFLVFPHVKAARAALDRASKERAGERAISTSCSIKDGPKGVAAP